MPSPLYFIGSRRRTKKAIRKTISGFAARKAGRMTGTGTSQLQRNLARERYKKKISARVRRATRVKR